MKTINVALQGGGAHGAFSWGVLEAFIDHPEINIEGLSATSAGAMNAAVFAYGRMMGGDEGAKQALETFWRKLAEAGQIFSPVRRTAFDEWLNRIMPGSSAWNLDSSLSYTLFDTWTRTLSPYQFNPFDVNPLRDLLAESVDFEALHHCKHVKLFISTTHVRSGRPRVFQNTDVTLDAVMASACLPFLFKAVEINGEAYWDGGYTGNPALWPLFYNTVARDIVVMHINPVERQDIPKDAPDIMNRVNEVSFNSSLLAEFRAIAFVQKLLEGDYLRPEKAKEFKHVLMHSIRADKALADLSVASKFNTDWKFLNDLRQRGYKAGQTWLDMHFGDLGQRSTVDLKKEFLGRPVG